MVSENVAREAARGSVRESIQKTAGAEVTVDKATLQTAIGSPSQGALDKAFGWLVPGLLILLILSLVGMFFLIFDGNEKTTPDLLLTAFTAVLTGLFGLFVKSPQGG